MNSSSMGRSSRLQRPCERCSTVRPAPKSATFPVGPVDCYPRRVMELDGLQTVAQLSRRERIRIATAGG